MKRDSQDGITLQEVTLLRYPKSPVRMEEKIWVAFFTLELPLQGNFMLCLQLLL
jgi:hypothetical protein